MKRNTKKGLVYLVVVLSLSCSQEQDSVPLVLMESGAADSGFIVTMSEPFENPVTLEFECSRGEGCDIELTAVLSQDSAYDLWGEFTGTIARVRLIRPDGFEMTGDLIAPSDADEEDTYRISNTFVYKEQPHGLYQVIVTVPEESRDALEEASDYDAIDIALNLDTNEPQIYTDSFFTVSGCEEESMSAYVDCEFEEGCDFEMYGCMTERNLRSFGNALPSAMNVRVRLEGGFEQTTELVNNSDDCAWWSINDGNFCCHELVMEDQPQGRYFMDLIAEDCGFFEINPGFDMVARIRVASANEIAEDCTDGISNDGDGYVDCEDFDCLGAEGCHTDEICSDFVDNDGNGLVDCDDEACGLEDGCF